MFKTGNYFSDQDKADMKYVPLGQDLSSDWLEEWDFNRIKTIIDNVDSIEIRLMFKLMADLRGMGEQNALLARIKTPTRKDIFIRAAEVYQQRFGLENGQIPASFEIVTLTGWAPHKNQQKPLRPGTATYRLATALDSDEKNPEMGNGSE